MAQFIILSGPSCVGKGPLVAALEKFYPELLTGWKKLVLYNSRQPRPGEVEGIDYHFRTRERVERFHHQSRYLVTDVRGDLQAIDLDPLRDDLQTSTVFFEGNPFIVEKLLENPVLKDVKRVSIFLSPLSQEEITFLKTREANISLHDFVSDVMRRKLLRRTLKQKTILSQKDLETVERRALSALSEMACARHFDYVVPNHDGEDSEDWDAFYFPIGDGRKTLECVAKLLQGQTCPIAEKWDQSF